MDKELESLETRVASLIARIGEIGGQNTRLADALAQALKENADLHFRLVETRQRVATLIERLPDMEEDA